MKERFNAGGISVGVETRHKEKVSPLVSAAMILGGTVAIAAGKMKKAA